LNRSGRWNAVFALGVSLLIQTQAGVSGAQGVVLRQVLLSAMVDCLQGVRDLAERVNNRLLIAGQRGG
jgi:hypothetical protein